MFSRLHCFLNRLITLKQSTVSHLKGTMKLPVRLSRRNYRFLLDSLAPPTPFFSPCTCPFVLGLPQIMAKSTDTCFKCSAGYRDMFPMFLFSNIKLDPINHILKGNLQSFRDSTVDYLCTPALKGQTIVPFNSIYTSMGWAVAAKVWFLCVCVCVHTHVCMCM